MKYFTDYLKDVKKNDPKFALDIHYNKKMINKLQENGILVKSEVITAFTTIGRGFFLPIEPKPEIYMNSLFKFGNLTFLPPHLYAAILENLDIQKGQSFLNIGSTTGYLNSVCGCLIGSKGSNTGIELNEESVKFAEMNAIKLKEHIPGVNWCKPEFKSISNYGNKKTYDRIFVEVLITQSQRTFICRMLNLYGSAIILLPKSNYCNNVLLQKVIKIGEEQYVIENIEVADINGVPIGILDIEKMTLKATDCEEYSCKKEIAIANFVYSGNLVCIYFILILSYLLGLFLSNNFLFGFIFGLGWNIVFSKRFSFYANMVFSINLCFCLTGIHFSNIIGLSLSFVSFYHLIKHSKKFKEAKDKIYMFFEKQIINLLKTKAKFKNISFPNCLFFFVGIFCGFYVAHFLLNLGFFGIPFIGFLSCVFFGFAFGVIYLACDIMAFLYGFVMTFGFMVSFQIGLFYFIPSFLFLALFFFSSLVSIIMFYTKMKNIIGDIFRDFKFKLFVDEENGIQCFYQFEDAAKIKVKLVIEEYKMRQKSFEEKIMQELELAEIQKQLNEEKNEQNTIKYNIKKTREAQRKHDEEVKELMRKEKIDKARKFHGITNDKSFNLAFCGHTKSGKSSLVNAIRGIDDNDEKAAKVGIVETTQIAARYQYKEATKNCSNIDLYDIPGAGTFRHDDKMYYDDESLCAFDFLFILLQETMCEEEIKFAKEALEHKQSIAFIHSKCDLIFYNYCRNKSIKEINQKVAESCLNELKENFNSEIKKVNDSRLEKIPCFYVSSVNLLNFHRGEENVSNVKYQEKELLEFIHFKAREPFLKWYHFAGLDEMRKTFYSSMLSVIEMGRDLTDRLHSFVK